MNRSRQQKTPRKQVIKQVDELLSHDIYDIDDWGPFERESGIPDPRFLVDHVRINDRGKVTQHPYAMSMETMRELIEWCDEHEYKFNIVGASEYFPGATFQIIFERKRARDTAPWES